MARPTFREFCPQTRWATRCTARGLRLPRGRCSGFACNRAALAIRASPVIAWWCTPGAVPIPPGFAWAESEADSPTTAGRPTRLRFRPTDHRPPECASAVTEPLQAPLMCFWWTTSSSAPRRAWAIPPCLTRRGLRLRPDCSMSTARCRGFTTTACCSSATRCARPTAATVLFRSADGSSTSAS